jgi:hypothetical protein
MFKSEIRHVFSQTRLQTFVGCYVIDFRVFIAILQSVLNNGKLCCIRLKSLVDETKERFFIIYNTTIKYYCDTILCWKFFRYSTKMRVEPFRLLGHTRLGCRLEVSSKS